MSHSSIRQIGSELDSLPMNRRHWTIFSVCAAGFIFDALDFQIMALVAPAVAKEWHIAPQAMGFVLSSTVVGMLLGSYMFGSISDRIGRRLSFQLTIALFAVFCGVSAFAQSVEQLAALRFLTGIGIGGLVPVDTAMMSEFMPRKNRGRLMALWAMFFPVGGLLAAFLARWIVPDLGWRALFLIGVTPAIFVMFVRRLVPESPRFLLEHGKLAQARIGLDWISLGQLKVDDRAVAEAEAQRDAAKVRARGTGLGVLLSREYRARTAMLWLLWFGWSFSYFGLLLWLPSLLVQHRGFAQTEVFTFIVGFMLCGIAGRVAVSFVLDRIGRRWSIAVFGLAAAGLALLFGAQRDHAMLIVVGYLFAFFHDGGLSAIAPYTPELYPTRARATGVGYANGCGRIASIASPIVVGFVTPMGLQYVFMVFACGYALAALSVLAFKFETSGMVLEEASMEDADGTSGGAIGSPEVVRAH